ncbi:MAG: Hsp20/alpha crystallin family protein [Phycisphaerales bacterium]|nr:Hsp20/alpha crystallin family protein [Phycisphaerales bacterium]
MTATMIEKTQDNATNAMPSHCGQTYLPKVDILEKPDELLLIADVPGATADGIDVELEHGTLTIHAHVGACCVKPESSYLLREYGRGDYHRSFKISEHIDTDKMSAEVSNGVLTLHLPKAEALKPRKITVKSI